MYIPKRAFLPTYMVDDGDGIMRTLNHENHNNYLFVI